MSHVVLLGDSSFDNSAYVPGGHAVVDHARARLPQGWRATLLAVDGCWIDDVHDQIRKVPADASHLCLSVGGNDLLAEASVLESSAGTIGRGMLVLAEIRDRFEAAYAGLIRAAVATGLPTLVCTVYEPPIPRRIGTAGRSRGALCLFDDAILRVAHAAGVPVLEMRSVCSEDADFANPIEPSSTGGEKIARSLLEAITGHDFTRGRTAIYP